MTERINWSDQTLSRDIFQFYDQIGFKHEVTRGNNRWQRSTEPLKRESTDINMDWQLRRTNLSTSFRNKSFSARQL